MGGLKTVRETLIRRESLFHVMVYTAALLFWCWVFFNTPYMNDDWYWGNPWGVEQLISGGTNGRYMGNLCIVLITRSRVFMTLFCGFVMWGLTVLISRFEPALEARQRLSVFLFANIMVFLEGRGIWQHTVGWLAGFANYVTSSFCLVLFFFFIRRSFSERAGGLWKNCFIAFGFSFAASLFVENISVYFLGLCLCALPVAIIRKHNIKTVTALLCGNGLGLALLLTAPGLNGLVENGIAGVRTLSFSMDGGLLQIAKQMLEQLLFHFPGMYEQNLFMCLVVLAMCALLSCYVMKDKKVLMVAFVLADAVLALMIWRNRNVAATEEYFLSGGNFELSLALLLLVTVQLVVLLLLSDDKAFFLDLGFIWLSTMLTLLPMSAVGGWGARLYFVVIVLSSMFVSEGYAYFVKKQWIKPRAQLLLSALLALSCCGIALNIANDYRVIGKFERWHREIISQAVENGDKEIYLPDYLPWHEKYLYSWRGGGIYGAYAVQHKLFYGIEEDVQIFYYSTLEE